MRVKICGISSGHDALAAGAAGADAIGLNFVAGPRQLDLDQAGRILRSLPLLVTPVALVRLSRGEMNGDLLELLAAFWVPHVQLYGDVAAPGIRRLVREGFRPVVIARVENRRFADPVNALLAACGPDPPAAVLLDAHARHKLGGTGQAFHWPWVEQARQTGELDDWPPVILAGGLSPENVAEAIVVARPWGVDVVTGVESTPGKKDPRKMAAFVRAAHQSG